MISVSADFKTAVKGDAKDIRAFVTDGSDAITEDDDLQSLQLVTNGSLLRTVMRQGKVSYFGTHDYLNQYLNVNIGVVIRTETAIDEVTITVDDPAILTIVGHGLATEDPVSLSTTGEIPTGLLLGVTYYAIVIDVDTIKLATSPENAVDDIAIATEGTQSGTHTLNSITETVEYIDYGSFKAVEDPTNEATDVTTLKLFDKMYESMQDFALEDGVDITYPCTMADLLDAICTKLSWTLATTSFPNDDLAIASDLFVDLGLKYRDVLDDIAEAAGAIMYFNTDDELVLRNISATSLETLTASEMNTLTVESNHGPINSLVLARTPQEDNIVEQDPGWTEENNVELRIENNLILDPDRETYISPIFDEINGIEYHPFAGDSIGLLYMEVGDRIIVEDRDENQFEVLVFDIDITISNGVSESLGSKVPELTSTNYDYAGKIGQLIKNVEIRVNKQDGTITLITEDVEEAVQLITELQQTIDGLTISIQGIGGTNLLKNSVGLKGDIKEWQILDEDGNPVDARNDAAINQDADVLANTESGSAIQLENQFITQDIATIIGEEYMFYCRFNKDGDAPVLSIEGQASQDITVDGYTDETWAVYSFPFTATTAVTTVRIENGAGDIAILSDMVAKLGVVTGWIQAPNEVYGANYKFDQDGFEVSSLTSPFKSVLDNQSLSVINTSTGKVVMYISKDSATLTQLIAQEQFTVQRYENSSKALKIIPTDTGAMLVINN